MFYVLIAVYTLAFDFSFNFSFCSYWEIPNIFKTGYITPVHKKGKDVKSIGNYRGITVASIFGKIFEKLLLLRLTTMNSQQSNLQFGFTKESTPAMAALLVSEATLDSKATNSPLFLATLDSQKAFDVVNHHTGIMLDKLYHTGANLSVWKLVKGMYEGLSARVKWKGDFSDSFQIHQGVRQGGILSTHLYKLYINELLVDLEENNMGKSIGTNYSGCPTCADDLSLMSDCSSEFGSMLSIAYNYACQHRYIIHPEKSVAVCKNKANQANQEDWMLGDTNISVQDQTVHLGLIRASSRESKLNVMNRISIARKTLYSLINVGCHGINGINPVISTKIYQVYVLPRLLSGLETLHLQQSDMYEIDLFHRKTLRSLQSFSQCTASSAVHLMVGILPIEPEIHKRQLSMLHSILRGENPALLSIMERQLVMEASNSHSFFKKVEATLVRYNLPTIQQVQESKLSKFQWKRMVKTAVHSVWSEKLRDDLRSKSSLKFCNIEHLEIGSIHPVWESLDACTSDVKKGIIKARMLAGSYLLRGRTNSKTENDINCQMCKLEKEDIIHVLTRCPETSAIRIDSVTELKALLDNTLGDVFWKDHIITRTELTKLILDSSFFIPNIRKPRLQELRRSIEKITRKLCYDLHTRRIKHINSSVSAS